MEDRLHTMIEQDREFRQRLVELGLGHPHRIADTLTVVPCNRCMGLVPTRPLPGMDPAVDPLEHHVRVCPGREATS